MTKYIEREALLQAILDLPAKMDEQGYGWLGRRGVWQMAMDFPAADVRPVKRGKWVDYQQGRWVYAKCSECETVHDVRSNYCPNCGADMREES